MLAARLRRSAIGLVAGRRALCILKPVDPYAVLGVARSASQREIRAKYLESAKTHHPDTATADEEPKPGAARTKFAEISAAYAQISDPQKRAETDYLLRARDPEVLAKEVATVAIEMCRAGRYAQALAALIGAMESSSAAHPSLVSAASTALELCAQSGEPHHARCARVYSALHEWGEADATAVNAYFQVALRGGHMALAMRAARHAETHGFEQSLLMRSTLRQVRRYKQSRAGAADGRNEAAAEGDESNRSRGGGGAEPFLM